MAKRKGNPDIAKYGFKKGDPRINRSGANRKLPVLKELMSRLLGHTNEEDMTQSEIAQIVEAMISTAKNKSNPLQMAAAKEIMERAFGKAKPHVDEDELKPIVWNETKTYKSDDKGKK